MADDKYTPEQVIRAIEDTKGLVTLAARRLNCHPNTIRNYAKRYKSVERALIEERERMTDVAELALYNKIQEGEGWAVCFYLKTQGKARGYVERQEIEHSGEIAMKAYTTEASPDDWPSDSADT